MDKMELQKIGVGEDVATALVKTFAPFFDEAEKWKEKAMSIVITDSGQVEDMKLARDSRLVLQKLRTSVEGVRKKEKETSLKRGKAIDSIANSFKDVIVPIEAHLQKQEDFVKNQIAVERNTLRETRIEELEKYEVLISAISDLAEMDIETYSALLETSKQSFEFRQEEIKKEAAATAAKEKAESEERERFKKENEKLKLEAQKKEKAAAVETKRLDAERKKQDKIIADQKAKTETERKAKEKLAAEIKAKADAEAKAIADEKAKKQAEEKAKLKAKHDAELAPDKAKLEQLAIDISNIKMPEIKDDKSKRIVHDVVSSLNDVCVFIKQECLKL